MKNQPTKADPFHCKSVLMCLACAALLANCSALQGQITDWNNAAGGNWSTPANWTGGLPVAGGTAQFQLNNTYTVTVDTNATFATLQAAAGNVTLSANTTPRILTFTTLNAFGNLTFSSPVITINGLTGINSSLGGSASFTGGTVAGFNSFSLGSTANNAGGTLIVDGAGSVITGTGTSTTSYRVGTSSNSQGTLTVRNGGLIDIDTNSVATLRVGGNTNNSTGTVNVETGGTLNTASMALGRPFSGTLTNLNGTLNLSGSGSQINQAGSAFFQIGGNGATNVGVFNFNGGTFNSGTGQTLITSTGTVNFNSGTWNANGDLTLFGGVINQNGGQLNLAAGRTLSITTGSDLLASGAVTNTFTGNTVSVSGSGSRYAGNVSALVANNSQIIVNNLGELSAGAVTLGATSAGHLDVTGASASGTSLVARNGSTVELVNGASGAYQQVIADGDFSVASGSTMTNNQSLTVGDLANGSVTVTGAGSSWTQNLTGNSTIGRASGPTGALTVSSGGSFSSSIDGLLTVNKTGQVDVNGGTFDLRGNLDVNGGDFSVASGSLNLTGNRALTVRNGGVFNNSNAMLIPGGSTLAVAVSGGTSSFQAQSLNLDSGSSLTINGGTATSEFAFNGGTVAFNSGTLRHTGSLTMDSATNSLLLGSSSSIGPARKLLIDGMATIESPVSLGGGRLSVGNITGGELLNLDKGIFQISGSTLAVGGGQLGDVVSVGSGLTVETTNGQNAVVNGNGRVIVSGGTFGSAGTLTNNGEIQLTSGSSTVRGGTLVNNSMLVGTGRIENSLQNNATGTVQVAGGERLVFAGSSNVNTGHLNSTDGGRLEFRNAVTNNAGGLIGASDGNLRFDGGLVNNGAVAISAGTTDIFGDITNAATGIINVSGGGTATFFEDVVQNGTMQVVAVGNTISSAVMFGGFTGSGGFNGGGDVFALGDLRPGNSPASVLYDGNLFLGSTTETFIELGGTDVGQFDQLLVTGDLGLAGDLSVSLINGFTLSANQQFLIGDIGDDLTGQFNGLGEGALIGTFGGRELFISYSGGNGNDISFFTAVPEPGVAGFGLLAIVGLALVRRRPDRIRRFE